MDSSDDLQPAQIRALRGELSRAAFARQLEVTPHAVYRWELPRDAKESRTPRGRERKLLEALRRGPGERAPEHATAGLQERLHQLFGVDHEHVHAQLLDELERGALPPSARAVVSAALSVHASMHHFDAERALVALGPALEWARTGPVGADAELTWVRAAEAVAYAMPNRRFFDPKRVAEKAHLVMVSPAADDTCRVIAACALASSMALLGEDAAMGGAFPSHVVRATLPELVAAHFDELHALRMVFQGESGSARQLLQTLVDTCPRLGCHPLTSRVLGSLAMRQLDDLADPDTALALAGRARAEAERGRLGDGLHEAFYVRAEIESHARRGDVAAALRTIEAYDERTAAASFATFPALAAGSRVLVMAGRYDQLDSRAARLRASCTGVFADGADAQAAFMEALAAYGRGAPTGVMVTAFERAEAKAHRSALLLRDVLVYGNGAILAAELRTSTEQWLRRTQRQVDRLPSLWAIAQLRRLEGVIAAADGDWPRARALLEMALAAFGVASDRVGAALVRWLYAVLAEAFGDVAVPDATTRRRELEAMGMVLPKTMERGVLAYVARHREASRSALPRTGDSWATRLLVPVARLTVRGADHGLLERELLAVLGELFAPHTFRLDEIDAAGNAAPIEHAASVEFGDGTGRRLRVSTAAPLDPDERSAMAVLAAVTSLALESSQTRSFGTGTTLRPDDDDEDFVAVSPASRALRRDVRTLAASAATVVVTGESGTGKEVVARALHDASPRAARPFVAFNCGAVPRELFEGQLFGHKRGAFTGATSDQLGMLRAAEGGTLFLDEIAELPLELQPKLLRVLENHEVTPLGATRAIRVDARIVAATHRDLAALVREGSFREDLFFRLQVVRLWVPPLRERREDIVPLARHFLAQLSKTPIELSPAAATRLLAHDFPGNVRELRNIVERSLAYAPGTGVLSAEGLRI